MTDRRRGLGRGLGALIPSARPSDERPESTPELSADAHPGLAVHDSEASSEPAEHHPGAPTAAGTETDGLVDGGARLAELDVNLITSNARQPREVFDEDSLDELVRSIREVGVLQPVVVRRIAGSGEARYELVMGERRWRAAQAAGMPRIPAIIRQTADDAMLRDALLENLHRAQLNPLEEAAAYDQLLRDFGCTQDELADRIGRSRPQISNTIRLLKLPSTVQRRLAAGVLSAGHARALLGLPDVAAQERLAQRIVAEGLSVRSVEEIVAVGDDSGGQPKTRPRRPVAPALVDLAGRLSERFETRVKVELGTRRGRITVEFGSIDDLERIVAVMDPDHPRVGGQVTGRVPADDPATEGPFTSANDVARPQLDDHPTEEEPVDRAALGDEGRTNYGLAQGSGSDRPYHETVNAVS